MSRLRVIVLICLVGIFAGCGDRSNPTSNAGGSVVIEPALAVAPLLRNRLPAETVLYLRLPSPWGVLSAPDGRALDSARLHPAHIAAIKQIRAAVSAEPTFSTGPAVLAKLLLSHWSGPAEMAVIAPNRVPGPTSRMLLSLPLSGVADAAALSVLIRAMDGPPVQFDPAGFSQVPNAAMHFDSAQGNLLILAGEGVDLAALQTLEKSLVDGTPPFAANEARIDQSGQGLFAWVDLEAMRPLMGAGLAQAGAIGPALSNIAAFCKSLSFGFGTVAGKGRMSLELDAPEASFLRYLPRETRVFAVKTVADPEYAGSVSILPSPQEFSELRAAIKQDFGPTAEAEMGKGLQAFKQALGLDIADLLAAFGPDIAFFSDQAGDFLSVKVRDRASLDALITKLNQLKQTKLARSGDLQMLEIGLAGPGTDADPAQRFLTRMKTRLFWLDEGDQLVFASVPQALSDRQSMGAKQPLSEWLQRSNGATYSSAMLLLGGKTLNVPRRSYYVYLGALQTLADLAGSELDPFAFASATDLKLPTLGSAGLAFETSRQGVAFSMSYDVTGFDLLSGGQSGLAAVAVAGILAAIALPAYQDYTARAQVSEALSQASAAKTAISEYALSNGRAPQSLADAGIDSIESRYANISWENNTLLLNFGDGGVTTALRGTQLALGLQTDGSTWVCGLKEQYAEAAEFLGSNPAELTTIPAKLLPAACRP